MMERQPHTSILKHFISEHDHIKHLTAFNLMTLLDVWEFLGLPSLEKDFARHLIRIKKDASLEEWLEYLHERTYQPGLAHRARVLWKILSVKTALRLNPLPFSRQLQENTRKISGTGYFSLPAANISIRIMQMWCRTTPH